MTDEKVKNAYKLTLNEIKQNLKNIHYHLCDMEKYVFDYETDEVVGEVQNIHKGYMQIRNAISNLRKLKGINNDR